MAEYNLTVADLMNGSAKILKQPAEVETRTLKQVIEDAKKDYIRKLLDEQGGNITRVAEIADVERSYLYKLMPKLGVENGRRV
jgi:DNA-binding NtrC family response regulator